MSQYKLEVGFLIQGIQRNIMNQEPLIGPCLLKLLTSARTRLRRWLGIPSKGPSHADNGAG